MKGFVLRRLEIEAELIIQSYKGGASFKEISEIYGCAWSTIRRFLLSHEVNLRAAEPKRKLTPVRGEVIGNYRDGHKISEIADRHGVTPQTVCNFLIHHGVDAPERQ